ncbi:reverse transcriptase domain-containing protein [Tanacetum coccineum]
MCNDGIGGGDGLLKAKSSVVIRERNGDEFSLEAIKEEEDVPLVDGILNGSLGAFDDMGFCFGDGVLASSWVRSMNNCFGELVECLALADLDRSTTSPSGIAEDVFVKVGKFHFPADFVVVDYVVDPRVPLILGRPFLRMARALIDVYGEELTLRVDDEAITFKVGQTLRYSYNDVVSINRIDVIDVACEEYAQEVLGFSDSSTSGNPTPSLDPILFTSSPSLTPFEEGDFILEKIEACLTNDSIPPGIDDDNLIQGDFSTLEKFIKRRSIILLSLPRKKFKFKELKIVKSSIDDPPELELKNLPSHPQYAFLEGTDKLPVIIAKNLKEYEKTKRSPTFLALMGLCLPMQPFAYVNAPTRFQRSMATIFHDMIEENPMEELLSNDSPSLHENESFHFDVPSSPRLPAKPPDDGIYFEPDTGVLTTKVVGDISEHYILMPKLLPTQPTLCLYIDTLLPFSSENEDKVHLLSHRGLKAFQLFSESPMMISGGDIPILDVSITSDYEASRARGFVLRSLELQSLA